MKRNYDDTETSATATVNPPKARRSGASAKTDETPSKEEMMKLAEAARKPGPGHKTLQHFVGNWRAEVKCWMEADGEPQVSQAASNAKSIMDGLFIEEDYRGSMMGKPFHGRTVMGYDNVQQKFVGSWISDMQSSMFVFEGQGEKQDKVLTMEGETTCPVRGRLQTQLVYKILGPDRHTFETYDLTDGKRTKTMEINYTRS